VETFDITASDGAVLHAVRLIPAGRPRAIVQIAHGMAEHIARYDRLIRRLAGAGYAVVGADHRGHGANAGLHGLGDFGPGGFAGVVEDMATLTAAARAFSPGTPIVLLGHSMGSFAAQAYLPAHGAGLSALVLSGTAALDLLLTGGAPGGLAAYNAAFEPARTPFDWLSRDPAEVDAYVADPLCGFDLAPASMASLPATVFGADADPRLAGLAAGGLPIYVISGEFDPIVGPGQAFTRALIDRYRAVGLGDIEHRVYPGGRHEMFNETNRDQVEAELVAWLDGRFP
jgi:alpha-beta hydrolase superfamily lysophospholipase